MNGNVQYELSILDVNNGKKFEDFHSRILRLQQEIMLSGETVSTTRIVLYYTKVFSKSDKLRYFIAPKMIDLITLLNKNVKPAVYTGEENHGIYRYLDMIGAPTTVTTSGQRYHHFSPSSSIKNDTASIQPIIEVLLIRQKSSYK